MNRVHILLIRCSQPPCKNWLVNKVASARGWSTRANGLTRLRRGGVIPKAWINSSKAPVPRLVSYKNTNVLAAIKIQLTIGKLAERIVSRRGNIRICLVSSADKPPEGRPQESSRRNQQHSHTLLPRRPACLTSAETIHRTMGTRSE